MLGIPRPDRSKRLPRATRCTFRQGNRRCPFQGDGSPALCRPHQIAVVEASRVRRPTEVIADAITNFLAGKPINAEATLGAAENLINQWTMGGGMAGGYHPDTAPVGDVGAGGSRPRPWWQARPEPRPPDQTEELRRVRLAARQVMGFAAIEPLTEETIKDRRRVLAKRHHPDKGGSVQKMAMVNGAADILLQALATA